MADMKKHIVEVVIGELFGKGNVDAVGPWLQENFVDHGPGVVASSRAEWIAAVRQLPLDGFKIEIHRLMEDGDCVTMLSRRWVPDMDAWIAVVDIFRFEDGLIAEHAEIVQPTTAPEQSSHVDSLVPW